MKPKKPLLLDREFILSNLDSLSLSHINKLISAGILTPEEYEDFYCTELFKGEAPEFLVSEGEEQVCAEA